MILKKIISVFSASLMLLTCVESTTYAYEEMRDISTMEIVRDMGIGINLGNTFESCPD